MDTPPATPQDAPANLTINAPSTPRVEQSDLAPPSPTSLCSSSLADARASTSPAAVIHPGLSPAWETKEGYEHHQQRQLAGSGAAAAAGTTPSVVALTISAPTTSADPSTPVAAAAAGPRPFSSTNLRPDLVPPRRETVAPPSSQVPAPVPGPAAASAAPAAPSPSGIDVGSASEIVERPGFFGSSTDTAASLPPSDAGVTAHVEPPLPEPAAQTTSSSTVRPPSSQSGISGVFELDLDSPLATSTTPPVDDMGTQDFARRDVGDSEGSVVVSRDSSAEEATAGAAQSIGAAPVPSLPWGRVAPSPDSSQPLPGPWGRLQEVMDEIKVMSPASPSSRVPHPFLSGARPSSTPAAEERKGFARPSSPLPISTRGRIAGSSSASAYASASSRIADSRQQLRQQEEKQQQQHQQQQQQQQQQLVPRSLSPSSSPRQVTSPPTPAASATNTPCETPTTAVQQPVALASSLPPSRHLAAVEEQSQRSASSPRASAAAADSNEPGVDTKQERQEETPPVPVPGWALGYSSSPFSSTATGTRGAEGEVAATAAPTAAAAAGRDSGAAPVRTAGHDFSDQAGEVLEDLGGDDTAEDLVNVRAVLPVEDDVATGGRGYVGQRFIQAAEALSESSQLRRAAGAAATAVSAAAGTARVQFTYTSRTIGKILVASAKSFEEFVDEQLQEDGSGQVLRREGGTGLLVPRGKQLSQAFIVAPGCCLCWEFRVKDHDLGFALRRRFQGMGGSTEEDIFELKRYSSKETFQGRWTADSDSNAPAVVIMVWDNSYSCLRPKTLAYKAQVNRPGIDPAAPPPPPPPTPDAMSAAQPPVAFGGGVGSVGGAEDTEAFAIDESEGEETSAYSAGVGTDRARVAGSSGGGGGEEQAGGEGDTGGMDASATTTSRRQGADPTIRGKGEGEREGGREREGEGVPKTVNIEYFLAMPETGSGDGRGGDRDGGADDGDGASK